MQKVKINECHNIESLLSAYIDQALPSWKVHIIRWHLKRCSKCSTEFTELQQTHTLLRNIEQVKASDSFLSNVMLNVTSMNTMQKENRSLLNRLSIQFDKFQIWMRTNIRTYNSYYIMGFFVGVFMMIGITLYSPKIEELSLFSQFNTKSIDKQERLVAFEVILQPEPKRNLKYDDEVE